MDWFRKSSRTIWEPLEENLVASGDLPHVTVEKREAAMQLRASIRRLTADQQQVLILRFGEELKLAQVARLMGKSVGAVKILQHRAVRRLQKLMT
jgi:RNA polymerase sigma-70 factor (ECF subfamily)